MLKPRVQTVIIIGFACIISATVAYAVNNRPSANVGGFGFTKDMMPVDIDLDVATPESWAELHAGQAYPTPVKLRIPKAFMDFSGNWKGGSQELVSLAIQQDLMPTALSDDPYGNLNNGLHITIRRRGGNFLYEKEILKFREKYILVPSHNSTYDEYRMPSTVVKDADMQDFVYIPKNASPEDAMYVKCNVRPGTPRCRMYDELGSDILIESIIPKTKIEDWMYIRANVRNLISRFCIHL